VLIGAPVSRKAGPVDDGALFDSTVVIPQVVYSLR
jgi:hypothetical protein